MWLFDSGTEKRRNNWSGDIKNRLNSYLKKMFITENHSFKQASSSES
jgi:hypothetical protein